MSLKHQVYQTTNLLTGEFYVGKHTCDCHPACRYLGSGRLLTQAIKTQGRETFSKAVLGEYESEREAYSHERKLIEELSPPYNSSKGGEGGFKEPTTLTQINAEGQTYYSSRICALEHKITPQELVRRLNSPHYPSWFMSGRPSTPTYTPEPVKGRVPLMIHGVEYASIREASSKTGHSYSYIKTRLSDPQNNFYELLERNERRQSLRHFQLLCPLLTHGRTYDTINEASQSLDLCPFDVARKLADPDENFFNLLG